jgi:hypothetical protein
MSRLLISLLRLSPVRYISKAWPVPVARNSSSRFASQLAVITWGLIAPSRRENESRSATLKVPPCEHARHMGGTDVLSVENASDGILFPTQNSVARVSGKLRSLCNKARRARLLELLATYLAASARPTRASAAWMFESTPSCAKITVPEG